MKNFLLFFSLLLNSNKILVTPRRSIFNIKNTINRMKKRIDTKKLEGCETDI
jgi:hypothetical protein